MRCPKCCYQRKICIREIRETDAYIELGARCMQCDADFTVLLREEDLIRKEEE